MLALVLALVLVLVFFVDGVVSSYLFEQLSDLFDDGVVLNTTTTNDTTNIHLPSLVSPSLQGRIDILESHSDP